MSLTFDQLTDADGSGQWYVKKVDGAEYGPETIETLARWAAESRIVKGNFISCDRKNWSPAEEHPALGMDWVAELPDGRRYGPFRIDATHELVQHNVLPPDSQLVNCRTHAALTVREYLEHLREREKPPIPAKGGRTKRSMKKEAAAAAEEAPRTADSGGQDAAEPGQAETGSGDTTSKTGEPTGDGGLEEVQVEDRYEHADKTPGETTTEAAGDADGDASPAGRQGLLLDVEPAVPAPRTRGSGRRTRPRPAAQTKSSLTDVDAATPTEIETAGENRAEDAGDSADLREQLRQLRKQNADLEGRLAVATNQVAELQAQSATEAAKAEEERAELARKADELGMAVQAREELLVEAQQAEAASRAEAEARVAELESALDVREQELAALRNDPSPAQPELGSGGATRTKKDSERGVRIADVVRDRASLAGVVEETERRDTRLKRTLFVGVPLLGVCLFLLLALPHLRGPSAAENRSDGLEEIIPFDEPLQPVVHLSGGSVQPSPPTRSGAVDGVPVIAGRGLRVTGDGNVTVIVFEEAVFSSLAQISSAGSAALSRIAGQLPNNMSGLTLVIEGHTDDAPVRSRTYANNYELGMARAEAVKKFLTERGRLPVERLRTASSGSAAPPYPDTTDEARRKNRTVVLRLVKHASP